MKKITIKNSNQITEATANTGELLIDVLVCCGFPIAADCGRKGTCGKCSVKLISGCFDNEEPDDNMMIRSCRASVKTDAVIAVPDIYTHCREKIEHGKAELIGIAVDIGTTTVAASAVRKDGSTGSVSRLNPQRAYGADVISRIENCKNGHLEEMTLLIRDCINDMLNELAGSENIDTVIISGNTTMLHILRGISPESMGTAPFKPQFTDTAYLRGEDIALNSDKAILLPSVSAFIGSDITAGICALRLYATDKTILFADLGTNGELIISHKGKLYGTSTAAGPTLEGACIECGTGGVNGAVDRVYKINDEIKFTTVGGAEPIGICGSGLIDAVALMLTDGTLGADGYMEKDFNICDKVYICQKDIRQFQLTKSAIYSGIITLMETVGITVDDIDAFYIAGGLGYYIDAESTMTTGLLPRIDARKIFAAGNTSLRGAEMCLKDPNVIKTIESSAKGCAVTELGGDPDFNRRFTENMTF